jgi:hypothetical protein
MPAALTLVPLLIWLAYATVTGWYGRPIPTWLMLAAVPTVAVGNAVLSGVSAAALACVCAVALWLVLAYTGVTSRATTVVLTVSFASIPLMSWWVLAIGVAAAAAVSAARVRRAAGQGYLTLLAGETLTGIGMIPSTGATIVGVGAPDVSRIPVTDPTGDGPVGRASRVRVRLPGYLFAGTAVIAVLALFGPR